MLDSDAAILSVDNSPDTVMTKDAIHTPLNCTALKYSADKDISSTPNEVNSGWVNALCELESKYREKLQGLPLDEYFKIKRDIYKEVLRDLVLLGYEAENH